mmetsp:Transcript_22972/g.54993  ORF Transcript_22972/g.54993 Transcript_22972/m.54993 type:complete len:241 (+) Transcript_22972:441-1163(+)
MRHRVARQLRLARVDEGALVAVLQRLARIVDELELRLVRLVLAKDVPVLPEGEAKHLALRVRRPPAARRRVELELLVQRRAEALGLHASAHARHRVLDLDVHRVGLDRGTHLLRRRLVEGIALAVEAVVHRVPPHHLVPLALERRFAHRNDWPRRQRRIERPVGTWLHQCDLNARGILDRARQHLVEIGVAEARKAAHGALRVAHALCGADEALGAVGVVDAGLRLHAALIGEALRVYQL